MRGSFDVTVTPECEECGTDWDVEGTAWIGSGDIDVSLPDEGITQCPECGEHYDQDRLIESAHDWAVMVAQDMGA